MENEQISVILRNEGLTASQLAERLGVQRSMISHYLSGRNHVSLEVMKKIHLSFPHISLQWLMDQEGDYFEMGSLFDGTSVGVGSSGSEANVDADAVIGAENVKNPADGEDDADFSTEKRDKMAVSTAKEAVSQSVPTIEKPTRKIVEIVVFYDDGTYENYLSRPQA